MIAWISANISTILITAVLIAVVTLIIVRLVKNRKKGVSSCGCSCSSCPMGKSCHQEET